MQHMLWSFANARGNFTYGPYCPGAEGYYVGIFKHSQSNGKWMPTYQKILNIVDILDMYGDRTNVKQHCTGISLHNQNTCTTNIKILKLTLLAK